ncbi:hypothetical protein ACOBQX_25750 [Actinokineospora sp. G85]|uniref:hypothetical protein n=1 Tax=Actinokineospora sp. G85 TaxID=3406626 RepID=UPI003C74F624
MSKKWAIQITAQPTRATTHAASCPDAKPRRRATVPAASWASTTAANSQPVSTRK